MIMDKDIVAVVVTYGRRFDFLRKTINSLVKQNQIKKIVIVQNGNDYDLIGLMKEKSKVHVIRNEKNLGSAGGFKKGMNYISGVKFNDYNVLVLDDDNVLDEEAIAELNIAEKDFNGVKHIWSLFRPNVQSEDSFDKSTEKTIDSLANTINGFTIEHVFNEKKGEVKRLFPKVNSLIVAPYSGLFFPQFLLTTVGLPDSSFYLYSDDIDFTLRISQAGFKILQSKNARCYDQSVAWQVLDESNHKSRGAFFSTSEIYRPLYTYRNEVFISFHRLCTNKIMTYINYFFLQFWLFFCFMPKNKIGLRKFMYLRRAMIDGKKGNLGKSEWIENTR